MSYVTPAEYGVLPPWRIDAERFDYLLNVLPPGRWRHGGAVESFYLVERLSDNIVMWAVRVGYPGGTPSPLYFCFQADADITPAALHDIVAAATAAHDAGTLPGSQEAVLAGLV